MIAATFHLPVGLFTHAGIDHTCVALHLGGTVSEKQPLQIIPLCIIIIHDEKIQY